MLLDLAVVGTAGPQYVIEAELGNENSRMTARPHVLEEERQPQNRHVADIEHDRAGRPARCGTPTLPCDPRSNSAAAEGRSW